MHPSYCSAKGPPPVLCITFSILEVLRGACAGFTGRNDLEFGKSCQKSGLKETPKSPVKTPRTARKGGRRRSCGEARALLLAASASQSRF